MSENNIIECPMKYRCGGQEKTSEWPNCRTRRHYKPLEELLFSLLDVQIYQKKLKKIESVFL